MQKETFKPSKNIPSRLLKISCMLMLLTILFGLSASADDVKILDETDIDEKISPTLASRISEASETEKINVIILMKNQHTDFNTLDGKSKIALEQKEILKFLDNAAINGKALNINFNQCCKCHFC